MHSGSESYELGVIRGVAALLHERGAAAYDRAGADYADAATRWPIHLGPRMPLEVDELVVLTVRPSSWRGYTGLTPFQVRLRSRRMAADGSDEHAVRAELLGQAQAIEDVIMPNGRGLSNTRVGPASVGNSSRGASLILDSDGSDRLGWVRDFTLSGRRRRT